MKKILWARLKNYYDASLRRTLVLKEKRQQGNEAIGKELFILLFTVRYSLFTNVPNVQVSDTTGDAMKIKSRKTN